MNKTKTLAFSGIVSAVSLVLMLIANFVPFADYTAPALAGVALIAIVIESNKRSAFVAYFVVAFLSMILIANKSSAMLFTVFLGYYPIIKSSIEQCKSRIIEWVIKLSIFNAIAFLSYFIMIVLLGFSKILDEYAGVAQYGVIVLLIIANAVFVLYDYALSGVIDVYIKKISPKLRRK